MRKKTHKQQRKLSTDTLLKTSKKKDIELTEEELGKVSAGVDIKGSVEYKDWIDGHSFQGGGSARGEGKIPFLRTVGLPTAEKYLPFDM